MFTLETVCQKCDHLTQRPLFKDFKGAYNGLQVANSGSVTKIGAAVDASLESIQKAIEAKVDFLIVHHGLFWNDILPLTDRHYRKFKTVLDHNLAIYASHLPLDAQQDWGNNASIAHALGLQILEWVFPYEGMPIAALVEAPDSRQALKARLANLFPTSLQALEFGSPTPTKVIICSGSGAQLVPELRQRYGVDTLITGEVRQHTYMEAQEERLNVYPCGHYATEVFGVQNLTKALSQAFSLPWVFIESACPL